MVLVDLVHLAPSDTLLLRVRSIPSECTSLVSVVELVGGQRSLHTHGAAAIACVVSIVLIWVEHPQINWRAILDLPIWSSIGQ